MHERQTHGKKQPWTQALVDSVLVAFRVEEAWSDVHRRVSHESQTEVVIGITTDHRPTMLHSPSHVNTVVVNHRLVYE